MLSPMEIIIMNKTLTKKLSTEKVINELETHPYYTENKKIFDKTIQTIHRNEKQMAIKDIMFLLEENFKHKNDHKKKFRVVLNELMLVRHKKKFSLVLKQMMLKKSNNNSVGYSPLLIVIAYFLMIIFIPFNWFDN